MIRVTAFIFLIAIIAGVQDKHTVSTSADATLYETIKEKRQDYYIAPQNAKIDKVWKKTPGLNGREVNVDKSYQNMKEDRKFNEKKLAYNEISPEISLKDLPAAPIYKGHVDKKMVSLLINVSWGEEYIPSMLKTFASHRIKGNFFIDGAFAKDNKQLMQMIAEDGHVIGSHGYGHPDFSKLDASSVEKNLESTNEILEAFTDENIKWFAPPSGSFSNQTLETAYAMNMETVLWSVDTIDWRKPTKGVLIERVVSKLHNGATILMHPTEVTSESLDDLIKMIKEDYKIVEYPRLISEKR
ncbi:polysaccharide deacetylase family protein [Halobacillus campisalis]|uniref:Polysaccharide deacetylase family protein n=1 Tax=Halobacillus campisalis TaxID=435909 RepID=A0ABW2K309_9BACI|nr:polysaccharide deacetylase family protein [Halobacillus campisalis]